MRTIEKDILLKAINVYGIDAQVMQAYEEMGELMSAINKCKRGRLTAEFIIDELADVSIMIEQLAIYYGLKLYESRRLYKLLRLKDRLKKYE